MDGLEDLDRAFAGLQQALSGAQLQACTDAAAQPILQDAQQRVPRRTGETAHHLVARGSHSATSATTAIEVLDSWQGGEIHKAVFVEYGTENMPAEPFMRPAFETRQQVAVQTFEQAVTALLKDKTS